MGARGLTAIQERELLRQSSNGLSSREIADWLLKTHGIKKSRETISRIVKVAHQDRSEATKTVVRDVLAKTLSSDLGRLEQLRQNLERKSKKKRLPNLEYCRLVRLEIMVIDRKLHYSGADEPPTAEGFSLDDIDALRRAGEANGG